MESTQDPSLKLSIPADDSQLDLYTIPSRSSWFSWDEIHDTERFALREFFDASSITRTPKIYKEYRDFIISKFREDPSRRLTFTEVRKSLVGDISLLHKVFRFLEKWGLINFGVSSLGDDLTLEEDEERWKVKAEEGAPHGVRVVAAPNSLKPIVPPPVPEILSDLVETGSKLPSLASYTDIYTGKEVLCGNCKELCDSGHYKHSQEGTFIICVKCFKSGNYGENKSVDDFTFIDYVQNSGTHGADWTESETLLLLESVLKHGDDWELVTQNVKTKSKLDCILKLIQLPFGELMVASANRSRFLDTDGDKSELKQENSDPSQSLETTRTEDHSCDHKDENQQNGDAENEGPPLKRKCTAFPSDAGSSLMKQVALISAMVSPHVAASAAEAAVTALCAESKCTTDIFDADDWLVDGLRSPSKNIDNERVLQGADAEMKERHIQLEENEDKFPEKNALPFALRIRAATATALGAAAAHAKLLADQEEREIEYSVAKIIEMQLMKVKRKMKHLDELELIMEKENAQMEEVKEYIIEERMNVLRSVFSNGLSRWRDHHHTSTTNNSAKPQMGS